MRSRLQHLVVSFLAVFGVLMGNELNAAAATNFNVTALGMSAFVIDGVNNPTLTLTKGQTYTFAVNAGSSHPFSIATARGAQPVTEYSTGVSNNGSAAGIVTFTVPSSAPATLFYQCGFHDVMGGTLKIVAAVAAPTPAPALGGAASAALAGLILVAAVTLLGTRARRRT